MHTHDELLSVLSHELRSPLAAILAAVDVLDSPDPGGETASEARAVIARQARKLTSMLDDLQDLSRLIAGETVLARLPMDLVALGQAIARGLARACTAQGHRLSCRLEPAWSRGDAARLEPALTRALVDALGSVPPGREVLLSVQREGEFALLGVQLDGEGAGNPGLALTLARRLVELHGGTLDLQATPEGSWLTTRLPSYPSPFVTGDS